MNKYTRILFSFIILFITSTSIRAQNVDSITTIIDSQYDKANTFHRFWLGDSYRKLYNTPVKMRVVDLTKEKGGLKVVKLGGGMQTQSLRLVDSSSREWVLRSIQKFPERSLPIALRNSIAKDIVQDQISIAHPFGALTIPTFNSALNIPHASPELVYVGDSESLGEYRNIFKNRAYIFEPRTPEEDQKTDNTEKAIRKLLKDNDIQTNQQLTLRSRLLDFLLGDWDRHEDNWRWLPIEDDNETLYLPVPRDRDKVFYKTSGVFPTLLSYQWLKAHLQPFSPKIRNISHWNFNQRHFDRFFLNRLSKDIWLQEAEYIQNIITDSLINIAMLAMPDTIYKLSANEISQNIKARRDNLLETASNYYYALAKVVDLPLSEKNEFIDLEILENGNVQVDIYNKKKDGSKGRRIFKRYFNKEETDEIRIYGLSGKDIYTLKRNGKSEIAIRIIGGNEYDTYFNTTDFQIQSNIFLYDNLDSTKNSIGFNNSVKYKLNNDNTIHEYDYNNFVYDRKGIQLNINYGVDRGLIFGLGYQIVNQGFRKSPYAQKHDFLASYLTGRNSFILEYKGSFKDIYGHNLNIDATSLGPRNLSNFFGFGNNSNYELRESRGIDYYRNRYDLIESSILLEKEVKSSSKFYYGNASQFYYSNSTNNNGRYFETFESESPDEQIFKNKFFTGIKTGFNIDTRNSKEFATEGVFLNTEINWLTQIGGSKRNFTTFETIFSTYKTFIDTTLTIANRTGVKTVLGDPYFFQHAQIGGEKSIRGYNSNRFTGKTAFFNNIDLRYKLLSLNSYLLPANLGVIGFYDVGRVWHTNENSSKWHMGYGGGIYFEPFDLFTIQAAVGFSKEATLPYIRIGMSF